MPSRRRLDLKNGDLYPVRSGVVLVSVSCSLEHTSPAVAERRPRSLTQPVFTNSNIIALDSDRVDLPGIDSVVSLVDLVPVDFRDAFHTFIPYVGLHVDTEVLLGVPRRAG